MIWDTIKSQWFPGLWIVGWNGKIVYVLEASEHGWGHFGIIQVQNGGLDWFEPKLRIPKVIFSDGFVIRGANFQRLQVWKHGLAELHYLFRRQQW